MKIKTILQLSTTILITNLISACGSPKKTNDLPVQGNKKTYEAIKSISWLMGRWENKSAEGTMTETWVQLNDSVYSGKSIFMEGKDTQFVETITIEQRGNEVFYIPVVKNQNDGKPTMFKLTNANGSKVQFENPEHDFPQKISYELFGDSLFAEISGLMEGKPHTEKFPMVRAK